MLLPLEVGTGAVITHIMQAGGRDELVLVVHIERWLHVEGVTTGKTHQLAVTGDPFIGGAHIAVIGVVLDVPHVRRLGDDIGRGRAAVLVDHGHGDGRRVWPVEFLAALVRGIFVDCFKVGERCRWLDESG